MRLWLAAAALLLTAAAPAPGPDQAAALLLSHGRNPWPVRLHRPAAAPLSAMAQLGRLIFYDASLSASGHESCATCHQPAHAYGPPGSDPAVLGGPHMQSQGVRAVPSLMYLDHQPPFSVGPDNEADETTTLAQMVALGGATPRPQKTAADTAQTATSLVPQGGLFWDGRVDTLQDQTLGPLLNPLEMAGGSTATLAGKLRQAPYAQRFVQLFGRTILDTPGQLLAEAGFALARYQIEAPDFHPYTSKFDFWLEGRATMTPAELRGYVLFNDPARADCAGCHVDRVGADGSPPLFTDHQFEALGAPRNKALRANADPDYFDLGLCGPYRQDLAADQQYCGMFLTPTLRNVATRQVFFHNGVFHTLQQVLDFYDFRDVAPARIYPHSADGSVAKYNDLPPRYRANADVTDPPFDRKPGDPPAMTPTEEADIIAFLGTLTDGATPTDGPAK